MTRERGLCTNRKKNASPFRSPKHIRWDRQRADQELLRVATEYGKCWNPIHWERLTQGYYDGFDDARAECCRLHYEDLAAITARHRAEIDDLKANWIPPDEADEAIQKIYALRKERDELLESMDLLRKLGLPAINQASSGQGASPINRKTKLLESVIYSARRAMNSSMPWTWFAKRLNARMLGTFGQEFRSYLPLFGLDNPKYRLVKPTL
jgi:hypothetical protein